MKKYIPHDIEPKWQQKWQKDALYSVDLDKSKNPYYLLVEFTYPSGDLHIGHWFAFAVPDILGRMKRMQGFTVFYPNGFDAFGLPAENAAIQRGIHPRDWTLSNIENMKKQFSLMGTIHDWGNSVITCLSNYYKWNQWIFLKMLEKGLAYKGKTLSNWCQHCQTVLANENVEAGNCWRCHNPVVQKEVEQWFLKITDYVQRLLWGEGGNGVDWPKALMEGQNNWIGKSQGQVIKFDGIEVFTTRQDTIFGATFIVISPEHPLLSKFVTFENKENVQKYLKSVQKKSELERKEEKVKSGVFTGSFVSNPLTGEQIPIWIADYVLMGYGTGAIMGVPAHDARDFEFAKKYDLPIKTVIQPAGHTDSPSPANQVPDQAYVLTKSKGKVLPKAGSYDLTKSKGKVLPKAGSYEGEGVMVNSGEYDGMSSNEAREKISNYLEEHHLGQRKVNYHLHDWSISRQRYWGTPIPIIYCEKCGSVPVPEKDLPVELPYEVDYHPTGKPPLATNEAWLNVKCPRCLGSAKRDTETMDTFVDSSWYFLRYLDNKNDQEIVSSKRLRTWMPIDIYFGGAEHTLGHTLYSRFFVKFLKDIGVVDFEEYAKKRVNHGVILGSDGSRMSKSRGNVVNPDEQVRQFGADAVRLYLAFIGPYDIVSPWNPSAINGVYHFLQRVWSLYDKIASIGNKLSSEDLRIMHKTIKKVTEDLEDIKFNTAVAVLMEWLNYLSRKENVTREEYKTYLLLLAPFAPHITEELWSFDKVYTERTCGECSRTSRSAQDQQIWSIHQQSWPIFDKQYLEEAEVAVIVQVNGRLRDILMIQKDILNDKEAVEKLARASQKVAKYLDGQTVKKVIHVSGKLINFVV
ncbi:MAG: leucine--tRNA ligase [Candidatus Daviesbacteria bacterium]|nr:MAG: leucine--tRNA ligase [Candidatus Daviesbacteria bacterium]